MANHLSMVGNQLDDFHQIFIKKMGWKSPNIHPFIYNLVGLRVPGTDVSFFFGVGSDVILIQPSPLDPAQLL